jgi:hypothetical protein
MNEQQKYNTAFMTYLPGMANWILAECNEILFWNKGNTLVTLNDTVVLQPNDYFAVAGNKDEIDMTTYKYFFGAVVGGGNANSVLVVIRKVYI